MKKILALLAAPVLVALMVAPAEAAQTSRLISDSGFCGPNDGKKVSVESGQIRRDNGTPNAPFDDEINFDYGGQLSTDVRISVPNEDLGSLSYRYADIVKQVDGENTFVTRVWSLNDTDVHVHLNFYNDVWHNVTKEPIVRVTAGFDNGATCVARAKWNSDW